METLLQLTPAQQLFILAVQVWIVVLFPWLLLTKLNHISQLLEMQFQDDDDEVYDAGS